MAVLSGLILYPYTPLFRSLPVALEGQDPKRNPSGWLEHGLLRAIERGRPPANIRAEIGNLWSEEQIAQFRQQFEAYVREHPLYSDLARETFHQLSFSCYLT